MLAGLVYVTVRPEPGTPAWFLYVIGLVVQGAAVGWGLFIHYRRQLVLSLLSVHAGALEFRPDAPAEEVERAARVIRGNAHEAPQDLREVIGVLRAPVGELPQPTLADVRQLVAESGRAYRVVQEVLTNARKHAPGAEVHVRVTGSPGTGLTVEVRNTAPPAAPPRTAGPPTDPGAGQGLAGLAERVGLASGRLEQGSTPDGGWRLTAWLPWPP